MCPWLGLGFTRTRTLTLTARRQGRAQSAPAARKKKQPVRHARSTEAGTVSPTSRLYLAYISQLAMDAHRLSLEHPTRLSAALRAVRDYEAAAVRDNSVRQMASEPSNPYRVIQ